MSDKTHILVEFENGGVQTHQTSTPDLFNFPDTATVTAFDSEEELQTALDAQ